MNPFHFVLDHCWQAVVQFKSVLEKDASIRAGLLKGDRVRDFVVDFETGNVVVVVTVNHYGVSLGSPQFRSDHTTGLRISQLLDTELMAAWYRSTRRLGESIGEVVEAEEAAAIKGRKNRAPRMPRMAKVRVEIVPTCDDLLRILTNEGWMSVENAAVQLKATESQVRMLAMHCDDVVVEDGMLMAFFDPFEFILVLREQGWMFFDEAEEALSGMVEDGVLARGVPELLKYSNRVIIDTRNEIIAYKEDK